MSAAAIRAGKAWVELGLKDNVDAGLAKVKSKFMRWGASLATAGAAISAAAGGILSAFTAASKIFADAGSQIFDLSKRTGASAEELSALGYAAEQSGGSMTDVAGAFKGLGKLAEGVASGNKAAAESLAQLGISAETFLAAKPYERLLLVADALQQIPDPGIRSALAVETLGRSASSLGSLLSGGAAGVSELVAEAKQLGLVVTDEEAKKADALGDAWGAVGKQLTQVAFVGGSALADILTTIAQAIQPVLAGVIDFIRNNQTLITVIAGAAAGFVAIGGALTILGAALAAAPVVIGLVGSALSFLFNPITLIAGALIAGVGYWLGFTQSGQSAISGIMAALKPFSDFFLSVFKGIFDAMAAGNFELAGRIAMAALNVAWQQGVLTLRATWAGFVESTLNTLDSFGLQCDGAFKAIGEVFSEVFGIMWKWGKEFFAWFGYQFKEVGNRARELLGLAAKPFKDRWNDPELAARRQERALATQQALSGQREGVDKVSNLLADLVKQAAAARQPKMPENARAVAALAYDNSPSAQNAVRQYFSPGAALGSFNAAMAANLRNAGPTIAEQAALETARASKETADNTRRMAKELEDLNVVDE